MECDSFDLDFAETPPHCRAFITTERDGDEKLQDLVAGEVTGQAAGDRYWASGAGRWRRDTNPPCFSV